MAEVKGVSVVRLSFKADPEKADPKWEEHARVGYSPEKWDREMGMNAYAGVLRAIFGSSYRPATHERTLTPNPNLPMRASFDFGKGTPARVWFGRTQHNGLRIFASMFGESIQLRPFVEQTIAYEMNLWGDLWPNPRIYCDPAGNQPKDDGMKSVEVLQSFGWRPKWVGGLVQPGIEAIDELLLRNQPDGESAFLIDPRFNAKLCEAFRSMYRRNAQGDPIREHPWIDLMDALRYGVMCSKTERRPMATTARLYLDPTSGYGRAPMPGTVPAFTNG